MSYHGYIPIVKQLLTHIDAPNILEVGIDTGATLFPLVFDLVRSGKKFGFTGIDVKIQDHISVVLGNINYEKDQNVRIINNNSLKVLPASVEAGEKYDIILLDGDHNYYTVKRELELIDKLTHEYSLVVVDDYNGRWAERDLWYAERDTHAAVADVTARVETTKHGVKTAVDELLDEHRDWSSCTLITGEPIVLTKQLRVTVEGKKE